MYEFVLIVKQLQEMRLCNGPYFMKMNGQMETLWRGWIFFSSKFLSGQQSGERSSKGYR